MIKARRLLHRYLSPILVKLYRHLGKVRPLEMAMDLAATRLFPNISIPFLESVRSMGSMEDDWDRRAALNSLMAATGYADEEQAEASAVKALETRILKGVDLDCTSVILEIGCGIGNLLKPLSALVGEAHGVDISGEMLRQAEERLKGCPNITLHKTDGRLDMFPDNHFDFVFSSGVFIHFPSKEPVIEYFKEVRRALKPAGMFRFHVDGRSYLKWRSRKGGTIRGVVFGRAEIEESLEKCGFQVWDITGSGTIDMWTTATLR